jgi:hypothetical protein
MIRDMVVDCVGQRLSAMVRLPVEQFREIQIPEHDMRPHAQPGTDWNAINGQRGP